MWTLGKIGILYEAWAPEKRREGVVVVGGGGGGGVQPILFLYGGCATG